jgi:hypothetical protein
MRVAIVISSIGRPSLTYVLPGFAANDATNGAAIHTESRSQFLVCDFVLCVECANQLDIHLTQFCDWIRGASPPLSRRRFAAMGMAKTTARHGIRYILFACACVEMRWSNAAAIITMVTDKRVVIWLAVNKRVSHPMRLLLLVADPERAISVPINPRCPYPTRP